jgi:hypothetical protein
MPFASISAGVSRSLLVFFGIEPQGNAPLIEPHVDPLGMNLNCRDHGADDCAQMLGVEILPTGRKPRRSVQKPLLGNGIGPMTLNRVQNGDWVGEPRADPGRNQGLDVGGRNALTPLRRLIALSH